MFFFFSSTAPLTLFLYTEQKVHIKLSAAMIYQWGGGGIHIQGIVTGVLSCSAWWFLPQVHTERHKSVKSPHSISPSALFQSSWAAEDPAMSKIIKIRLCSPNEEHQKAEISAKFKYLAMQKGWGEEIPLLQPLYCFSPRGRAGFRAPLSHTFRHRKN